MKCILVIYDDNLFLLFFYYCIFMYFFAILICTHVTCTVNNVNMYSSNLFKFYKSTCPCYGLLTSLKPGTPYIGFETEK